MADPVADGVWWLHGTRGSNVYLVDCAGALLLVDTGLPGCEDAILEEIAAVHPDRRLEWILLTHAHRDHSGSARQLRQKTGARVCAGAADTRAARPGRWVLTERSGPHRFLTQAARFLTRRPVGLHGVEIDERIEGRTEMVPGMTAVPVPGHTAGSYCYVLEDRGVALVGDLVIAHRDGLSRPLSLTNADEKQYLASLAAFADEAPPTGCPGHGAPVAGTFGKEIRELAQLPRRHLLSPGLLRERMEKLVGFSRRLRRRRRPR